MKEFFSELDIDETKQKKRLLEIGFRVPRRKSILPHHLHSVMGSANLRLAHRDMDGALKLCKEVIRQGNTLLSSLRSILPCQDQQVMPVHPLLESKDDERMANPQ